MRVFVRVTDGPRGLGAIECGIAAGVLASAAIFATRLVGDDLAEFLFAVSHGL